jgi:hypothetical protein
VRSARNWGRITSGATFEALATALVAFEDPKAALFGRRGKDGGQDVRSGDGTRVYQAKHHEQASAAKAIADAKREVARIKSYREPTHKRSKQWTPVTAWTLLTNAVLNPTDREKWDEEVVPLFQTLHLSASIWAQANLDTLLDKHPEIDRSFFENETRAFLTISEAREQMVLEEPFLQREALGKFVGREHEQQEFRDFLNSDRLFLVVHGAGGLGKTRLLLEACDEVAAEGQWQVLWALKDSMEGSSRWFDAIVRERPTILVVDEPASEALLRKLREQLGSTNSKWKIAVTARSTKDPVLHFILGPRMKHRSRELPLLPLRPESAEEMCRDLLDGGPSHRTPQARDRIAHWLSERLDRHPIWLTLAVALLDRNGDLLELPATAEELADRYIEEVVESQKDYPKAQVQSILQWVAILGTVNREDDSACSFIAEKMATGDTNAALALLRRLVTRKALVARGARNRLVEVKPDVLRDRLLTKWLSHDVGTEEYRILRRSAEAVALVETLWRAIADGDLSPLARKILISLARTELQLHLSGRPLRLLDELFTHVIASIPTMSASKRIALLNAIPEVAYFRSSDTVAVSRALRSSPASTETIEGLFKNREVSNADVLLEIAWPIYHAAMGVQALDAAAIVLEEFVELTRAEAELLATKGWARLPNDGKRAAALLQQTLEGGPNFTINYQQAGETLALRLLEKAERREPDVGDAAALNSVIRAMTTLQKSHETSDGYTLHIQRYLVAPGQPEWLARERIVRKIKDGLTAHATPSGTRRIFWDLLGRAHAEAAQSRDLYSQHQVAASVLRNLLLDDLVWAEKLLLDRGSWEEFSASRKIWSWHAKHDPDVELSEAAQKIQVMYSSNELAMEFQPLLRHDRQDARAAHEEATADKLVAEGTSEAIESFMDRASRFVGGDAQLSRLNSLAWALGKRAPKSLCLQKFIKRHVLLAITGKTEFAIRAAEGWVAATRTSAVTSDQPYQLVRTLFEEASGDQQRIRLLRALYSDGVPGRLVQSLDSQECNWLRSLGCMFLQNGHGPTFISAVAWTLRHDWSGYKTTIESILSRLPVEQLSGVSDALIDRVYWAVEQGEKDNLPSDLVPWLLEQLMKLPEFESTGDNGNWELNKIVEQLGLLPISWLPAAMRAQVDAKAVARDKYVHSWTHPKHFVHLVQPISESNYESDEVRMGVSELLELASDRGATGYFLPDVLSVIDPSGLVVPAKVAQRLLAAVDREEARALAKLAGAYPVGSAPWRTIARPAIRYAMDSRALSDPRSIFSALTGERSRSWTNAMGEVAAVIVSAVVEAKRKLEDETDPDFKPFWEWHLDVAQDGLLRHEQDAKEERGE